MPATKVATARTNTRDPPIPYPDLRFPGASYHRHIVRGFMSLKLFAFKDEGASACRLESSPAEGGTRPISGGFGARCRNRSSVHEPAGARARQSVYRRPRTNR